MANWDINDFEFQLGNALFDDIINEATDPLEKYKTQLHGLSIKFGLTPEEVLKLAMTADPTNKDDRAGDYVGWLLKQMKFQNIRLPEDLQRVKRVLVKFHELKRGPQQPGLERDINKYIRFSDLEEILDKLSGKKSNRAELKAIKQEGVEPYKESNNYLIVKILTPKAATIMAQNTKWCTSNENTAADYIKNSGGLYVIFQKIDDKLIKIAQFTADLSQIQNIYDRPFQADQEINQLLKPTSEDDPMLIVGYANNIAKQRMPEFENVITKNPKALGSYVWAAHIPGFIDKITDTQSVEDLNQARWKYNIQISDLMRFSDKPTVAGALLVGYSTTTSGPTLDDKAIKKLISVTLKNKKNSFRDIIVGCLAPHGPATRALYAFN